MIDKSAGLPTQIRQLEKRLKEMDASKVKPALVKEITDTIKNLKDMLKEKQEKREQRKKDKAGKVQEVEAADPTAPGNVGAVAPNNLTTTQPGQPEATPTTPDDKKVSCPLCGGMTFNDQASYQQHMEFTHASDIMPTTPGQKLDKTVASVEPTPIPSTPEAAPAPAAEQGPQFKLDDEVKPIRGNESKGKVMRWDGKPNDLVYVMWESGPLKDRDTFGGYYPHDLQAVAQEPVEAVVAPVVEEPVCENCVAMQEKHGDLRCNYDALLKDLKDERQAHYDQGNHSWTARLDDKIKALQQAIDEKFGTDKTSELSKKASTEYYPQTPITLQQLKKLFKGELQKQDNGYTFSDGNNYLHVNVNPDKTVSFSRYGANNVEEMIQTISDMTGVQILDEHMQQDLWDEQHQAPDHKCDENCPLFGLEDEASQKTAGGGPREIREVHQAVSGHGYEATTYDLTTLKMYPRQTIKINDTKLRMTDPTHTQFEVRYDGQDWKMVTAQEYEQWKGEFQRRLDEGQNRQGAAENAEQLTIMDHTPPRANSGPDDGGTDSHDEFQDEWAMPVTSETKLNVFKRELLATPSNEGYDISHEGKKLFNIKGKENKLMNKKQLEFCAQIELTRGMKQAKLTTKIANLEAGSTVFIMAEDKTSKRVKFASLEHGFRGWAPVSKFAYMIKEGQMMQHKDHIDNTFGTNGKETLVDCPNGSGNMVWLPMGELLPVQQPPATPESLNDLESSDKEALKPALPPAILNQRTDVNASACHPQDITWNGTNGYQCLNCGAVGDHGYDLKHTKTSSLNKVARVVHREDGWHVLSEKGKNLGGPYKSKGEAVKRLRQVEYFKHNSTIRPFGRKVIAEALANPYQSLTDHITDMRGRMSDVQERIQTMPAIKTAGEEAPKMDLPALFEDITHGIALLEDQLGGDESAEHKMIEELENKLWKLEEECGITPKLNEHEKAEPEYKEIVEDIEKKEVKKEADTVTDETVVTNDPNAVIPDPNAPADPTIQNVQPTDDNNLENPTVMPSSPPPPGTIWQWNSTVGKYLAMPDPAAPGKTI